MAAVNTPGGPRAERNLLNRLRRQGIGANQIEALYTERSPCRRSCQPFLRQRGIPPERVYYSFNYNTPAGRRLAHL